MQFSVSSRLTYQVNAPATFLILLRCLETANQKVLRESLTITPQADRVDLTVAPARNRFTRFEISEPGPLTVAYDAIAQTGNQFLEIGCIPGHGVATFGEHEFPYLFPSRYAPADLFREAAGDLFGSIENPFDVAMAVEEWLYRHITYEIGASTEQCWALDTFLSRAGVCRDFAHLGIAFCRALNIPARYVTVYACQLQPQDFHAVFEVFIGGKWYLIDGTRLAPLNGLVRIATGRDAGDVSMANIFGNVVGTGVEVATNTLDDQNAPFVPVTRQSLLESGKALSIV